jgi:hypothetical protein
VEDYLQLTAGTLTGITAGCNADIRAIQSLVPPALEILTPE